MQVPVGVEDHLPRAIAYSANVFTGNVVAHEREEWHAIHKRIASDEREHKLIADVLMGKTQWLGRNDELKLSDTQSSNHKQVVLESCWTGGQFEQIGALALVNTLGTDGQIWTLWGWKSPMSR